MMEEQSEYAVMGKRSDLVKENNKHVISRFIILGLPCKILLRERAARLYGLDK
jgi:hypothetical protein